MESKQEEKVGLDIVDILMILGVIGYSSFADILHSNVLSALPKPEGMMFWNFFTSAFILLLYFFIRKGHAKLKVTNKKTVLRKRNLLYFGLSSIALSLLYFTSLWYFVTPEIVYTTSKGDVIVITSPAKKWLDMNPSQLQDLKEKEDQKITDTTAKLSREMYRDPATDILKKKKEDLRKLLDGYEKEYEKLLNEERLFGIFKNLENYKLLVKERGNEIAQLFQDESKHFYIQHLYMGLVSLATLFLFLVVVYLAISLGWDPDTVSELIKKVISVKKEN